MAGTVESSLQSLTLLPLLPLLPIRDSVNMTQIMMAC